MRELIVEATIEKLDMVHAFIHSNMEGKDISDEIMMDIDMAVEEIYVNIAHYAYNPNIGKAEVRCQVTEDPLEICIEFLDQGVPYNPLGREDPDVTLSAEERAIGGLGIYLVKQLMDHIEYKFENNKNILIIKKAL